MPGLFGKLMRFNLQFSEFVDASCKVFAEIEMKKKPLGAMLKLPQVSFVGKRDLLVGYIFKVLEKFEPRDSEEDVKAEEKAS